MHEDNELYLVDIMPNNDRDPCGAKSSADIFVTS